MSVRMASSFLAAQGPMNTTFALEWCRLISLAVNVMGVNAMEIQSACSGNSFLAIMDQAGEEAK